MNLLQVQQRNQISRRGARVRLGGSEPNYYGITEIVKPEPRWTPLWETCGTVVTKTSHMTRFFSKSFLFSFLECFLKLNRPLSPQTEVPYCSSRWHVPPIVDGVLEPRCSHTATRVDERIFVIGGGRCDEIAGPLDGAPQRQWVHYGTASILERSVPGHKCSASST